MLAPLHPREAERMDALHAYNILDSLPEQDYDDLVRIAAAVCGTPIAAISLIDTHRQWFKSVVGLGDVRQTSREAAICAHAILADGQPTVVLDLSRDRRFADSPLIDGTDESLRFYAGAPIISPKEGLPLGMICVADREVRRTFTTEQETILSALSRQISHLLELRRCRAELMEANEQLAELAATDPLTGLLNRRAFEKRLVEEIGRSGRAGAGLSLLMIDVDYFKHLNDAQGHAIGDDALRAVAQILRNGCRMGTGDLVARLGGEEFVVLLPGTPLRKASILAERLRATVANSVFPFGPMTISIGAAQFAPEEPVGSEAGARLLAAADNALYQAKAEGRNRVVSAFRLGGIK